MTTDITDGGFIAEEDNEFFDGQSAKLFRKEDPDQGILLRFEAEPRHINRGGVVHGGMLMTFADQVLGFAASDAADGKTCSTMSLNCDFVAAARIGDVIEGRAWVTRRTRSVIFVQGEVSSGGQILMTATGVWKIIGAK
ncbi:unnamed protein product [Symbiodinium microadriaticum]|nr:unnamed protein product [Symbiodinium microadriaticum]